MLARYWLMHDLARAADRLFALLSAFAWLHACRWAGRVYAYGRVRVHNAGEIELGDRVMFLGGLQPTLLACSADGRIQIGSECCINYGAHIDAACDIRIGNHCFIASFVHISDHVGHRAALPIVLEDGVWVAHGAIIEPGVRIGRGSVVAAGSVVTRDVPADSMAIGNPARVLRLDLVDRATATGRPRADVADSPPPH